MVLYRFPSLNSALSLLIDLPCLTVSIYHDSNPKNDSNFKTYRQNFGKGGMASLVANIRRSTTEWLHRKENSENKAREAEYLPSFFPSPVSGMNPVCRDRVRHGYLANFGVTVQHRNYQARNVKDYNLLDYMRRTQHKYKGN